MRAAAARIQRIMKIKFSCRNFAKHAYHQIVMRTRNNNDKKTQAKAILMLKDVWFRACFM